MGKLRDEIEKIERTLASDGAEDALRKLLDYLASDDFAKDMTQTVLDYPLAGIQEMFKPEPIGDNNATETFENRFEECRTGANN